MKAPKRLSISIALAAVMAIALTGCSEPSDTGSPAAPTSSAAPTTSTTAADPTTASRDDQNTAHSTALEDIEPADYLRGVNPVAIVHFMDPRNGSPLRFNVDPNLRAAVVVEMGIPAEPTGYYVQFFDLSLPEPNLLAKVLLGGPGSCEILTTTLASCETVSKDGQQAGETFIANMVTGDVTPIDRLGRGSLVGIGSLALQRYLWYNSDGTTSLIEVDGKGTVLSEVATGIELSQPEYTLAERVGQGIVVSEASRKTLYDASGRTAITSDFERCAAVSDGWICLDMVNEQLEAFTLDGSPDWTSSIAGATQVWDFGVTSELSLSQAKALLEGLAFPAGNPVGVIGIAPNQAYFAGMTEDGHYWVENRQIVVEEDRATFQVQNPEVVLAEYGGEAIFSGALLDPATGQAVTQIETIHYHWDAQFVASERNSPNLLAGFDLRNGNLILFVPPED